MTGKQTGAAACAQAPPAQGVWPPASGQCARNVRRAQSGMCVREAAGRVWAFDLTCASMSPILCGAANIPVFAWNEDLAKWTAMTDAPSLCAHLSRLGLRESAFHSPPQLDSQAQPLLPARHLRYNVDFRDWGESSTSREHNWTDLRCARLKPQSGSQCGGPCAGLSRGSARPAAPLAAHGWSLRHGGTPGSTARAVGAEGRAGAGAVRIRPCSWCRAMLPLRPVPPSRR